MNNSTWLFCAALALSSAGAYPQAESGRPESAPEATKEQPQESAASAQPEKEKFGFGKTPGYLVMPIPIANPTIGAGLGLVGLFNYKHDEQDTVSPTSSTGLFTVYTNTDSWMAGVFQRSFINEDTLRFTGFAGYARMNLNLYGVGDDPQLGNDPVKYSVKGAFLRPRMMARVSGSNWFLGGQWTYMRLTTTFKDSLEDLLPIGIPLEQKYQETLSAVGVVTQYDTRDSIWQAKSGNYFELSYNRYDDIVGSDRNYGQWGTFYNHYFTLAKPLVLAVRAEGTFAQGDIPFYALPTLNLRGFDGSRYRDNNVISLQGEFRWQFSRRWGASFFAGAGKVAEKLSGFDSGRIIPAGGVGVRWLAAEKEGINLSVDVAKGPDSGAVWYFRIGEQF